MLTSTSRLAVLTGLALAAAGPAAAGFVGDPLPGAYFIYTTQADNVTPLGIPIDGGAIVQHDIGYVPGAGHAQLTGLTTPTLADSRSIGAGMVGDRKIDLEIEATATAAPVAGTNERSSAYAETNLIFSFEINGPAGTTVPVNLKALFIQQGQSDPGSTGIWGEATAFSQIEIGGSGGGDDGSDFYLWDSCPFPGCVDTIHHQLDTTIQMPTNTVFQFDEAVLANASVFSTMDQITSYADADPTISIEGDHPGVSLSFSPGIASAVGTPEPAAWALMLLGVGLTGGALRRRAVPARA